MLNLKEYVRIYFRVALAAAAVYFIFIWAQDIFSGEEGRVRKFIIQSRKAVEARDIFACADKISGSYRDKYGNERSSLIYITRQVFSYYANLLVHIQSMDIRLDESKNEAVVEIVALVIGENRQNQKEKILEGEKGRFKIKLIKEDKRWQLLELEFLESLPMMGRSVA